MEIKRDWIETLNRGVITPEILAACLYSANKRAKNEREEEYRLREAGDTHGANKKKKEKLRYYGQKYVMLRLVSPRCIHVVRNLTPHDEYYHVTQRYFLYYKIGDYTCHRPLREGEMEEFKWLDKRDIGTMHSEGAAESELLPQEFIDDVCSRIRRRKVMYKTHWDPNEPVKRKRRVG